MGGMMNQEPTKIIRCGCCDSYHRLDYTGDCRNDAERIPSFEDAIERFGRVVEYFEDGSYGQVEPIGS